ncbi:DUF1697 domain-containing protein [Isoptericola croceus]|uniref:DUF1697 domain-containing protein n=1 Tax=Isoptericola croceus TaxID=3031406 RepID=UPI0023F6548E|nr:DUF1697 domain-containing protein [Isoptericola croceus]
MTDSAAGPHSTLVALLRAVNVGGTGKLAMSDLRSMCSALGFSEVRTYIASGNVLFSTSVGADAARAALEEALREYAGKPVGVLLRTPTELERICVENPFLDAHPSRVGVTFLDAAPDPETPARATGADDEEIALGAREVYVHYPSGMGRSRLNVPTGRRLATTRNMNTVTRLAALSTGPG